MVFRFGFVDLVIFLSGRLWNLEILFASGFGCFMICCFGFRVWLFAVVYGGI